MRFGHQLLTHSKAHENYFDTVFALARATEELGGIESLWFHDHVMFVNQRRPEQVFEVMECFTSMAAVAAVTSRVRIGSYVLGVPYRNPALVAKAFTTLDLISHGRAIVGLGAAWNEVEFRGYGWPFPPASVRLEMLEEAIQVVLKLMTERPATFHGQHYTLEAALNDPPPIQKPRPPLMIGGGGERKTLRLVARYADYYNVFQATPDEAGHKFEVLRQHCREVGRDYDEIVKTNHVTVLIARDEAELARKKERYRWFLAHPLIGTPDRVIAQIREYRAAGSQYLIFNLSDAEQMDSLRLMAEEVIPALIDA
ncbi:MAG TPA: TIGR03560 family F420-dependent LLM class oxidoreductase [Chloroflexota bacterium]|jgi:F420-dependent oxidoreductase-like protein|nr:TIGR03560 family F420-dependent LLM class oxidoreductase [Chloroflexota bacterium]